MAEFPIDPPLSRAIIAAGELKCSDDVTTICSLLQVSNEIFYRPKEKSQAADMAKKGFTDSNGDHLTLLNVYNTWINSNCSEQWCRENYIQFKALNKARNIKEQLEGIMDRVNIPLVKSNDNDSILKSLLSGYFYNVAQLTKEGIYRQVKENKSVEIHPSSVLFSHASKWVMFYELVLTTKEYIRQVSEINPEWLSEVAPHVYKRDEMKEEIRKYYQRKKH